MQAVILAAGQSSRCWPVNQGHKSQIKVFNRPLIYWTVKGLADNGIKDVVLIVGPDKSYQEKLIAELKDLNLNVSLAVQEKPLGTGNAVFQAKDHIKEPFLVIWPYKVNSKELVKTMLEKYQQEKSRAVLVGVKTKTPWDYGILKMSGEKVLEIVENPAPGKEPSDVKTLGTYLLQPDFFEYYQKIGKHHPEDFIDGLNLYIKEKGASVVFPEKKAPSLKYPWEILGVLRLMSESDELKNNISSSAIVGKNVVVEGKVYIGDNTVIGDNAVIKGPCFIGDNCKIGAGNVLRGPVNLSDEVVTGALAEIKNCLIERGTHLHSGYFGDSVIGENCRFGAGFVTANARIDRNNVKSVVKGKKIDTGLTRLGIVAGHHTRFGIKSGTMPGVLIGSNCLIGPGTLVFENLADDCTFFTKFKNVKKKRS